MAGAGVIDAYVTALDRRLQGPDAVKDDLLAEARDSLDDATEVYRDAGLTEEQAQRRAVADFGPVGRIARDYQGVLALAQGVRTLRALLLVVPFTHAMWETSRLIWIGGWPAFGPTGTPPVWYLAIARANDWTGWIVAAVALVALFGGRLLARRGARTDTLARLAGSVAVGMVGTVVFANLSIVVATLHVKPGNLVLSPMVTGATVASMVILARLLVLARRCVVFASV
ncbi:permease prefix domain 1-containing protein [Actinosynnema sp. NPDC020468]|uniref:permease prefix domain 1-containing protein n=1 Tax=Actinosynnema sp. NPDC020468 TaxID=3154488 RepID=UPI00340B9285